MGNNDILQSWVKNEMAREQLAEMTDQELLAYERTKHGDPHMTPSKAKALQATALRFRHGVA